MLKSDIHIRVQYHSSLICTETSAFELLTRGDVIYQVAGKEAHLTPGSLAAMNPDTLPAFHPAPGEVPRYQATIVALPRSSLVLQGSTGYLSSQRFCGSGSMMHRCTDSIDKQWRPPWMSRSISKKRSSCFSILPAMSFSSAVVLRKSVKRQCPNYGEIFARTV